MIIVKMVKMVILVEIVILVVLIVRIEFRIGLGPQPVVVAV